VGVDRQNVDDRAGGLPRDEVIDQPLHEKERCPGIDREQRVPRFRRRVGDRSARGDPGGIDQTIDATKTRKRGIEDNVGGIWRCKIGGCEIGGCARGAKLGEDDLRVVGIAVADHHAGCAAARHRQGDGTADALRRAGNKHDPAIEAGIHHTAAASEDIAMAPRITPRSSARPFRRPISE
jgi:hypothetical protein